MGRQLACIRTFFINGQGPLKRQVTCVPMTMRQLNRQLRVREVAAVRKSVCLSARLGDACGVHKTDKCSIEVHVRLFRCMCVAAHMHIPFHKGAFGDTNRSLS